LTVDDAFKKDSMLSLLQHDHFIWELFIYYTLLCNW